MEILAVLGIFILSKFILDSVFGRFAFFRRNRLSTPLAVSATITICTYWLAYSLVTIVIGMFAGVALIALATIAALGLVGLVIGKSFAIKA